MNTFFKNQAFIIDMDGVLWHGDNPQAGLIDFFKTLRNSGLSFVLATNNASLTPEQYVKKLATMGVKIEINEIITSAIATVQFLAKQYTPHQTKVFVIGEQGLTAPLKELGFNLCNTLSFNDPNARLEKADLVICGLDRQLNWEKLATAALHIQQGAVFIGANGDSSLPTERGNCPGNGATLAALEATTGVKPQVIGKPEPIMYQQAMALLKLQPEQTIAIGDRLDTDILGAEHAGMRSIMVLSGISSREDIKTVDYSPTWVMSDITEITAKL